MDSELLKFMAADNSQPLYQEMAIELLFLRDEVSKYRGENVPDVAQTSFITVLSNPESSFTTTRQRSRNDR